MNSISVALNAARGRITPLGAYVTAVAGVASATALVLVLAGGRPRDLWALTALAFVATVSEHGSVRLSRTTETSVVMLPILFAAVLFGPVTAMVVAAVSQIGDLRGPRMKWVAYTSTRSITAAATGLLAVGIRTNVDSRITGLVASTIAGAAVAESLDVTFAAVAHRLRGNGQMRNVVRLLAPGVIASVALYAPIIALLTIAYVELTPWTLPLFLVPAIAAQRLWMLYREQRTLTQDLVAANTRLEHANLSFATALVATLDARDQYTAGHSAAVAIYARDIAARMNLSDEEQQLAHVCGLVHDIGKIGLPPGLLEKPGALTLEERRQMERHAEIGERILARVDDYAQIAAIVRHHHERVDGLGYPDGLAGDEIPLISRILAVADAYNAMTSDRPYRDAMPSRVARLRLAQAVEAQFDTSVVAAFEAILAGAPEHYRNGLGEKFRFDLASDRELAAVASA